MKKAIIIGILTVVFLKIAYNVYSFVSDTAHTGIESLLRYALIVSIFLALTALPGKEKAS
ncbi:hypothetical protein AM493_14870 [Flavobacterium akiainvivens]|uniref:Uncharacterized protein n=1 Tax=Flavobacterium akiainvivens TaxID=1202724 RepID=A0A0N0RQW9_9FLAO|nr:hypothetical protein [Flavobacterium akiainvivens]KOS07180.1 hypothetical protein AM493_14870 [Flavobacterium akiainvivens]SFQ72897.1 hypothetical protein SAMN05444144_11837 [Flavobacterium akiainvivens]